MLHSGFYLATDKVGWNVMIFISIISSHHMYLEVLDIYNMFYVPVFRDQKVNGNSRLTMPVIFKYWEVSKLIESYQPMWGKIAALNLYGTVSKRCCIVLLFSNWTLFQWDHFYVNSLKFLLTFKIRWFL